MTINEKKTKITLLQSKNINAGYTWGTVGLLGSIGGVFVAHKMGYKFWGKVGFFFLGGMVAGLPMRLILANKMVERNAEITKLQNEVSQDEFEALKNQAALKR